NRAPIRERGLLERPPETDSWHPAGAAAGKQPRGLASLSIPIRRGTVQWTGPGQIRQSAQRRRHPQYKWLSRTIFRWSARRSDQLARIQTSFQRPATEGLSRELPRTEGQPGGLCDDGRDSPERAPG